MSKEHLNYLRRKTADEAELWAADLIEELERDVAELKSKLDEAVNAVHRLSNGQPFDAIVISDTVKRRTAQIEQENDQLREQVKMLHEKLTYADLILEKEYNRIVPSIRAALAKVRKP